MPSILIPAHNEANVIARCLTQLVDGFTRENFEIIVVCNGCDDNTADIVRSISNKIICLETYVKSKTYALNYGEKYAHFFPRIYQDADVIVTLETIDALCEKLKEGYLALSPTVKMNFSTSSYFVRAYYDIWLSLPYCEAGMIGAGVYALSEKGRMQFESFPEIIADDEFVRLHFNDNERTKLSSHFSYVSSPKRIEGLIRIKTRSRLGGYQLRNKFPELVNKNKHNYNTVIKQYIFNVKSWPRFAIYLYVNIFTRIRAKRLLAKNNYSWERDDTSRSR